MKPSVHIGVNAAGNIATMYGQTTQEAPYFLPTLMMKWPTDEATCNDPCNGCGFSLADNFGAGTVVCDKCGAEAHALCSVSVYHDEVWCKSCWVYSEKLEEAEEKRERLKEYPSAA